MLSLTASSLGISGYRGPETYDFLSSGDLPHPLRREHAGSISVKTVSVLKSARVLVSLSLVRQLLSSALPVLGALPFPRMSSCLFL